MGLQFIVGPAGSGKTRYILESIISRLQQNPPFSGKNLILLVPDQSTYQMERAILAGGSIEAFTNLHILSFSRLCHAVLDEVQGVGLPFITSIGKDMTLQSIIWKYRNEFQAFGAMAAHPGFRSALAKSISELKDFRVNPAVLRAVANPEHVPFLQAKAADLQIIYDDYLEFLRGRYVDPDDFLEMAAGKMAVSQLVKGSMVWIDGFSGFTPKEYEVISALLENASQVQVALCLDRDELRKKPDSTRLFYPTRKTHDEISMLAWKSGVTIDETIYLEDQNIPRFAYSPELACLEKQFRGKSYNQKEIQEQSGVFLISAANPHAEGEFVAREILRLVRDEGLRYKDITVELRELGGFADLLSLIFKDYGIPYFLDRKSSVAHHPLAELVRSAIDMYLTGFSFEAVFRYLKTDLVPVTREEVDILENYVLKHGIKGEHWISQQPWHFSNEYFRDDEVEEFEKEMSKEMDEIRKKAMSSYAVFYKSLKKEEKQLTARHVSHLLRCLLDDLNVYDILEKWSFSDSMHMGVWDKLTEILDQATEILGDHPVDMSTYSVLINAGLEDIRLGLIPPSLDQLLIGSFDRSRQPDCKVTFLMGAVEGLIPARAKEDCIFTDDERDYLSGLGINLEAGSSERQLRENYLMYIAVTRPSDKLYISYYLSDENGKAVSPSPLVHFIKKVFPEKQGKNVYLDPPGVLPDDLDFVVPARAAGIAAREMAAIKQGECTGDTWYAVFKVLKEENVLTGAQVVFDSLEFTNKLDSLPRELAVNLYGKTMFTSVSKLERYKHCPFWHFAENGLRLKEREVYKLEPAQAGTFLHKALREYFEAVRKSGKDWHEFSVEDLTGIMEQVCRKLIPEVQNELLLSTSRYRFISSVLKSMLRKAVEVMSEHLKKGKFRPVSAEVLFGFPGGLPPLVVETASGEMVKLRGQIDRVDVALEGDKTYIRVIDYKSSDRRLDLASVYYGLSLQLLVYLLVVTSFGRDISGQLSQVIPAGALYSTVKDPFLKKDIPPEETISSEELMKQFRLSGILPKDTDILRLMDSEASGYSNLIAVRFTKDGGVSGNSLVPSSEFNILLKYVKDMVGRIAGEIYSGNIEIKPYRKSRERACRFCPYSSFCIFDVLLKGNKYNILNKLTVDEAWSNIKAAVKEGESNG